MRAGIPPTLGLRMRERLGCAGAKTPVKETVGAVSIAKI